MLTSHSFEDPQGLLPMLAFLTSTEDRIVSDSVSLHTSTVHYFDDYADCEAVERLSKETLKAL